MTPRKPKPAIELTERALRHRAAATTLALLLSTLSLGTAHAQDSKYDDAIYCGVAMDYAGGYEQQADRAADIAASIHPQYWEDDWADEDFWLYIDFSDDEIDRIASECAKRYQ